MQLLEKPSVNVWNIPTTKDGIWLELIRNVIFVCDKNGYFVSSKTLSLVSRKYFTFPLYTVLVGPQNSVTSFTKIFVVPTVHFWLGRVCVMVVWLSMKSTRKVSNELWPQHSGLRPLPRPTLLNIILNIWIQNLCTVLLKFLIFRGECSSYRGECSSILAHLLAAAKSWVRIPGTLQIL